MRGNGGVEKPAGASLLRYLLFLLKLVWEQTTPSSLPSKFFSLKVIPKEEWCQAAVFQSEFPAVPEPGAAPEPWL